MIKIGLVQINTSFSGQNYFPYSVGLIQSYSEKHCAIKEDLEFVDSIYKRIPVNQAVECLKDCSVIGFSTYVWNIKLSLQIAKTLKSINPTCLIVFGGPQVPNKCLEFMKQYPFIDICVHGEGEQVFTQILENKDRKLISSISFFDENGNFVVNPRTTSLKLEDIPSPYLNGVFDRLIEHNPNEQWLGLWETNRGCPFSCTYCDWGSATMSKVRQFDIDRLHQETDWFAKNKVEFVFCCDANYGMLVRDIDISQYVADTKKKTGYPHALSVQNTKNATERSYQVQKILASVGLNKGVTLSVQSMDLTTLRNIKRDNISLESYQELQRRFMKDKIETYSDMILAMPGETYDSFIGGIDQIIENGQHNRIQFNNLSILPNAEMGNPEYQKKFGMKTTMTKIINMHGSLSEVEDESTQEMQELVIETNTMSREDWVKTRSYCWMTALLHFDKLLQIPLIILNKKFGIKYRTIFESFMNVDITKEYSTLNEIREFFINTALAIQNGAEEYVTGSDCLDIWWPADEFVFIKMVRENKIDQFYKECESLLLEIAAKCPTNLLLECVELNKSLVKLPNQLQDQPIILFYNVLDFYYSMLKNEPMELNVDHTILYTIEKSKCVYTDWNVWLKEVVWYGNKKGGYLHGNCNPNYELAGHH